MCRHRAADRWYRFWERFTLTFLAVLAVAETYGLFTVGPDAAYTNYWRRLLGQLEPCRHSKAGRASICAFGVWLIAHFGWGKFGFGPRRPTVPKEYR